MKILNYSARRSDMTKFIIFLVLFFLVEKIRELLKTDVDLSFLLILKKEELETLVAGLKG